VGSLAKQYGTQTRQVLQIPEKQALPQI
jgi:hypothetical protein